MDETGTFDDLAWLRRLARSLVRDTATAEDAVQETLIAASDTRAPSRLWLARTLRNFVRQEQRSRMRRSAREASSAPGSPSHAPAPDELLAELESHRMLADEVRALDEPYRQTLLLRFVREWTPRRIAGHQGVPVKTVHTRIERGLARLRARLDRRAPRERWLSALAVMGEPRVPWTLPIAGLGVTLMSASAQVALVAAVAALLGLPFLFSGGREDTPELRATAALPAPDETDGAQLEDVERSLGSRAAVEGLEVAPAPDRADGAAGEPPGRWIRGLVVDVAGAAVRGVRVTFRPKAASRSAGSDPGPVISSDADGRFRLPCPAMAGLLEPEGDDWVAVHRPFLDPRRADEELVLVVGSRRSYAGRVVDEDGAAVSGARVAVALPGRFLHPLPIGDRVLAVRSPMAEATTDDLGSFHLDAVGALRGASVVASRDGYESARIDLPAETTLDLRLVLAARPEEARVIRGTVVTEVGTPALHALVSAGGDSVAVQPDGTFSLPIEPWRTSVALRAIDVEHGVVDERLAESELARALEGAPIELLLPGRPPVIRGRVVDELGDPLAGVRVWTPDTTWFGSAPVRGERALTAVATTEALASGHPGPFPWVHATHSNARGEFELTGLVPRSYDVFASNDRTLSAVGPVRASPGGGDLRIELPTEAMTRVAGVVVDGDGRPLVGLAVRVGRDLAWERPVRVHDRWKGSPLRPPSASCGDSAHEQRTDGDGCFEFPAVVLDGSWVSVRGDEAWMPTRVALDAAPDPLEIRIVVRTRAELVVRCRSDADAFRLESDGGRMQPLLLPVEDATVSTDRAAIVGGRSLRAITGSGPVVLVLLRGDDVLERRDVVLREGLQVLEL